jgi:uncharacterized protein DUF4035
MLRSMTSRQFSEWMVYASLDPFDAEREDMRVGLIVSAIYNVNRDRKKRAKPFTITDCMPLFGDAAPQKQKKVADWRFMKALGKALTLASQEESAKTIRRS